MKPSSSIVCALILLLALSGCDLGNSPQAGIPSPAGLIPTRSPAPTLANTPRPTALPTSTAAPTVPPTPTSTAIPTAQPTAQPTSTPDPEADFARAMRPPFAADIKTFGDLPRYDLRIWIDTEAGVLTGTEQIDFSNRTGAPLHDIALRLYPNFPADVFGKGGDVRMDVSGAAVAGRLADVQYAAQHTAALLALPEPLNAGAAATLSVTYTATLRPWRDGTWPLPSYYPMLAVHDSTGWRLDVTTFADHVYAESALYSAEITAPAGLSVAATGTTIATQTHDDRSTTYSVRSGPVREFALTVGDFSMTQAVAGANGDVALNVYTARRSGLDTKQIADLAAEALADFDRRFGSYPYAELDIQLLPYDYDGGDEYPGLILLYSDAQVDAGTRYVAAHEVAHQWWYGVVGNDIYRSPWLDEALAQYSGIVYDEDIAGAAVAETDWEREVLRRYRGALDDGDLPIGLGIGDYPTFNVYYRTIYGKGPVFLGTLREQLGDEAFFKGLQIYYQSQRYQVATTEDIQRAFEQASGRDLNAIFAKWVSQPKASYSYEDHHRNAAPPTARIPAG
jgi:hypothetical protein